MKEIGDFAAALHLAIKALQFYSAEHPRVTEALTNLEGAIVPLVTERGRVSIVRAKGKLLVDGRPLDMSTASLKALEKHLAEHDFGGIVFMSGVNARELLEVIRLFTFKPQQVKDAGGPDAILEHAKVIHARISHVRYAELTDGEEVVWAKSLRSGGAGSGSGTGSGTGPGDAAQGDLAATMRRFLIAAQGDPALASGTGETLPLADEIRQMEDAIVLGMGADRTEAELSAQARDLLREAVAGFAPEIQFTLLVAVTKLPTGQLRDILAPAARQLLETGFAPAARSAGGGGGGSGGGGGGGSATPGEKSTSAADLLRELMEGGGGGGGGSDAALDLIRGRLEELGISREQLDELLGIFGWEKLGWSEKIEKLLSGDKMFDFPRDKLLSFLRELIMARKHQEVYYILERYGRGLGHESFYIRQNVSDTLGQVAGYIIEPGLSPEIEQLLSKLLLNHLIRENDARMHTTVGEASANLLDALVHTGRAAVALGHLKRLGTASAAASAADPTRAAGYAALLQAICEPRRAERLIVALSHADAETFNGPGIGLLTFLGEGIAGPLIMSLGTEEDRNRRGRLIKALKAIGKPAYPHLMHALQEPVWYVVRNTLNVLGDVGAPEHAHDIGKRLTHSDGRVRRAAARALGKIGGAEAEAILVSALPTTDHETQAEILLSLGGLKSEVAVPMLIEIAGARRIGGDDPLREMAVATLGQIGSAAAIPLLVELVKKKGGLLGRDTLKVRMAAAKALAHIGTSDSRDALEKAIAAEADASVRAQLQAAAR